MRRLCVLAVATLIVSFAGCQGPRPWDPPGPLNYQHSQAAINDPFPMDDLGPSDATMRPPGFEQPLPQAVRTRIVKDTMATASAATSS